MNTKVILILFILLAIAQLAVPAKMILDSEEVLQKGTIYNFELHPVDPVDPIRGKYMTLRFKEIEFTVDSCIQAGITEAFIEIEKASDGFAKITNVTLEKPSTNVDFLQAKVYCNYFQHYDKQVLNPKKSFSKYIITYPFEKYFMNEKQIVIAEEELNKILRDTTKQAYGEVMILNGQSRLQHIKVDGTSIEDYIR